MNSDALLSLLTVAIGMSFLITARMLWRLFRGVRRRTWLDVAMVGACLLAATCLATDGLHDTAFGSGVPRLLATIAAPLLVGLIGLLASLEFQRVEPAWVARKRPGFWFMASLSFALLAASCFRYDLRSNQYLTFGMNVTANGKVVLDPNHFAVTDKGTKIPLFHFTMSDEEFDEYQMGTKERFAAFGTALIHRDDADMAANCHGWVFTKGRFLVRGEDVDAILAENGYEVVTSPKIGDVVIYRDFNKIVRHTGLVQGVLGDGTVLIESKWGIDQRFLHRPEDQPYSTIFQYYRSTRENHVIDIRDTKREIDPDTV